MCEGSEVKYIHSPDNRCVHLDTFNFDVPIAAIAEERKERICISSSPWSSANWWAILRIAGMF
jgi:hypothetical protein